MMYLIGMTQKSRVRGVGDVGAPPPPLTTITCTEVTMADRHHSIYGPEFQERRLEALERDQHRCCACNHDGSEYRLEVHHRTYENGASPRLEDLYTFCVRCHDVWTDIMRGERYGNRDVQVVELSLKLPIERPTGAPRSEVEPVDVRATVSSKPFSPSRTPVQIPEYQSAIRAKPIHRR